MHKRPRLALALALAISPPASALAQSPPGPNFGISATPVEIAGWNIDVEPSGAGLPPGSGTPSGGAKLFATTCASCHGSQGQGIPVPGRGPYPRLVGGIGTLKNDRPVKTVGSFWPFATILFDYIHRAMPLTHPQSLSPDDVYALTAFILWKNGIIANDATMDAQTLPAVRMPNAEGFFTRPPAETSNAAPVEISPFGRSGNTE